MTIDRLQIRPSVAKELEARREVIRSVVTRAAQAVKRRPSYTIDCIWRHTFRKQSPERLDVTIVCGNVYGPHRSDHPGEGQTPKSSVRALIYGRPSEDDQLDNAQ